MTENVPTMAEKRISIRKLRQGAPEEKLSPGESLIIQKRGGKVFELRRVDGRKKSMSAGLDRLLAEMPSTGAPHKADMARIIIEDRE